MIWIRWGSLLMFIAVALGALGAHALKDWFSIDQMRIYQTAVMYQLVHGLALLIVGCLSFFKLRGPLLQRAGWSFFIGSILFSGSLYILSVTGIKKLGLITPFGGLAFLIGWLCLLLSARP